MLLVCLCIYFHFISINKKWFGCPIPCQTSWYYHFDGLLICLMEKILVWYLVFLSFKINSVVLNVFRYFKCKDFFILKRAIKRERINLFFILIKLSRLKNIAIFSEILWTGLWNSPIILEIVRKIRCKSFRSSEFTLSNKLKNRFYWRFFVFPPVTFLSQGQDWNLQDNSLNMQLYYIKITFT